MNSGNRFGMTIRGRPVQLNKTQCLNGIVWLGRQDSNLGMAESKSAALPLGYAPLTHRIERAGR
jgi:hypothetical protein